MLFCMLHIPKNKWGSPILFSTGVIEPQSTETDQVGGLLGVREHLFLHPQSSPACPVGRSASAKIVAQVQEVSCRAFRLRIGVYNVAEASSAVPAPLSGLNGPLALKHLSPPLFSPSPFSVLNLQAPVTIAGFTANTNYALVIAKHVLWHICDSWQTQLKLSFPMDADLLLPEVQHTPLKLHIHTYYILDLDNPSKGFGLLAAPSTHS